MELISKSLRLVLEWGTFVSCLWLALSIFNILLGFQKFDFEISNYFLIWSASFVLISLTIIFSIKTKWKTITTLALLTAAFFFFLIAGLGFNVVISKLFGEQIIYSLTEGLLALIIGGVLTWTTSILLRSEKLK